MNDPVIFWAQEKLSDYRGKIKPGTYLLNTHETVDEMLAILSGKNTEGQPSEEEESSSSDAEDPESGEESAHDRRRTYGDFYQFS